MKKIVYFLFASLMCVQTSVAQDLKIDAPDGWRNEVIRLPPEFAPDMKVRGVEVLRFAPGMFEPESDSFFSYVFAFRTEDQPRWNKDVLKREMLVYYQGLANSVMQGNVDKDSFTFKFKKTPIDESQPNVRDGLERFSAELSWVEPFATRKRQILNVELDAWHHEKSKKNYLFVCASPKKPTEKIWDQMREIRDSFHKSMK